MEEVVWKRSQEKSIWNLNPLHVIYKNSREITYVQGFNINLPLVNLGELELLN